jgi:hypothetical protein
MCCPGGQRIAGIHGLDFPVFGWRAMPMLGVAAMRYRAASNASYDKK